MSLKTKDLLILVGLLFIAAVLFLFSLSLIAITFLLFSLLAIQFIHYRRLQRQAKNALIETKKNQENFYKQTESFTNIVKVLPLIAPLPSLRHFAVSPDLAKILVDKIIEKQPKQILECGSGVSSLIMGYALKLNKQGSLISLESDEECYSKNQHEIKKHQLEGVVSLIHAPLKPIKIEDKEWQWYDTAFYQSLETIDLLFVDGPFFKTQSLARYPALPLLFDKLSPNAIIVVDDMIRPDEQQIVQKWLKQFPQLKASTFPTEKGTVVLYK